MNNTFNINRFILLFKKYSIENAKIYLLSAVVIAGILFAVLGFNSYISGGRLHVSIQGIVFLFTILGSGSIFTSLAFNELGDKKKAIAALTLPASHFEKYLVSWIYSYVIFQLVFVGIFYLVDMVIIHLGVPPLDDNFKLVDVFNWQNKGLIVFIIYTIFHALAFWGAIFFEKLHFIKTASVVFAVFIIVLLLEGPVFRMLTGIDGNIMVLDGMRFTVNQKYYHIDADKSMELYAKIGLAITILLLWTSAYFKLKEKEV